MKLAFLGDVALVGKYDLTNNPKARERLRPLADKLKSYDYVIANLETPLTEKKSSWIPKSMHLRSSVRNAELLKFLHINAVSLSNNHIYDFGTKGIQDTIKNLDKVGIEWFGVNSKSLNKKIKNNNICISGFCCYSTNGAGYAHKNKYFGINVLTWKNIADQISKDIKNGALSIFSIHWGREHTNYPNYEHVCLAKKITTLKEVIIHGHHPHIIQGVQKVNNSLVAYSLGNCLFDDCTNINGNFTVKQNEHNKTSFLLEVSIEKDKILDYKTIGFKDEDVGISFHDINSFIHKISTPLENIQDVGQYNLQRNEQINRTLLSKFGRHDFKWLMSRLNYYSLGARVTAIVRKRKYKEEAKQFMKI